MNKARESNVHSDTSTSSFSSQSSIFEPAGESITSVNLTGFANKLKFPDRLTSADDGVRCVVIPNNVVICYGPYMVQGILDYRTERLRGLEHAFYKLGIHTDLKKSHHINLLRIWYMDSVIFSCKLTDLNHGGDGSIDSKSKQVIKVFQSVFHKAGQEMHARQGIQKTKDDEICNFCVCNRQNNLRGIPDIRDIKSISSVPSLNLSKSGSFINK